MKNRLRELKLAAQASSTGWGPNANLQLSDRDGGFSYSVTANAAQDRFENTPRGIEVGTSPAGVATMLRTSDLPQDGGFTFLNLGPRLNWTLDNGDTLTSQTWVNRNRFRNAVQQRMTTLIGSPPPHPDLLTAIENTGATCVPTCRGRAGSTAAPSWT